MSSGVWADQPYALIKETGISAHPNVPRDNPAVLMAQNMALAHNVIFRSINASYNQCLSIRSKTPEATDFLTFNQCIFEFIKTHHDVEEEHLFPDIAKLTGVAGIMEGNVQEHRDFEAGMEKFHQYVYDTPADKYDRKKLQAILDEFGKPLEKHMHNEISTLLNLKDYDQVKLKEVVASIEKQFTKGGDVFR
ncbi:hypothetical protein ZTR_10074 [Talaromyces verruculosus]|nr:hypothetical protein ZTR_10074 [Talaromyces verruculosus]